jgi:hypothetical protein
MIKRFFAFAFLAVILISQISCSIQKKHYLPGYTVDVRGKKNASNGNQQEKPTVYSGSNIPANTIDNYQPSDNSLSADAVTGILPLTTEAEPIPGPGDSCDIIVFRNGEELEAKVSDISTTEIFYKKCANLEGPTYTALQSDIFMIKYPNGTRDLFKEKPVVQNQQVVGGTVSNYNAPKKKVEGMGIFAFCLSLAGLLVPFLELFIVMELASVIFGIASLSKINNNDGDYKGRGFGTAAIIIGVVFMLLVLIALGSI